MKKIILMLILYHSLYTQDAVEVGTVSVAYLTQGYILESISGRGFPKSIYNHVANLSSSNPAAVYDDKNISMGISYQLESTIRPAWIVNINHERGHQNLPQSCGIVLPLKNYRIGFGYSQRYNSILDLGKFEISTVENPEGTGEFFTARRNTLVSCYSGFLSYAIDNLIQNNYQLSIGIQLNYNTINFRDRIYHALAKASGANISWTSGLRFKISEKFQFGLFYTRSPFFREQIKVETGDSLILIDIDTSAIGNNSDVQARLVDTFYLENKLPDKLNLGLLYKMSSALEITFELTKVYWNQLSDNSFNSIDISGSLIGHMTENVSLCASFLSTGRKYDDETDHYFNTNDNLYGFFLLAGLNVRYKFFDLDIAYMTNTSASGAWRKQRIGKVAMGFYL